MNLVFCIFYERKKSNKNIIIVSGIPEKFKDIFQLASQLRACGIILVRDEKTIEAMKSINSK